MGGKDVLTGWVQVSRALTMTKGPSVALVSVPRVVSAVCVAAGEAVTPWAAELIEESVAEKVEEGNGVEADEGGLLAMMDLVASPGTDSVLENGLNEKAAELPSRTPDVAKEAMESDRDSVNVSPGMVSAEDRISVPE